ncbi:Protein kinase-like domain protein [Niveomyces insectorum RCEF 264]|uniref:Protein kinase-like domain protein n=1 Tax=Niveomyces insectorum RCEF 264 TaxID=1081102 RepID=A0A167W9Y8_9HYPO|nr:Protein kinase-like domain protein [Niveomyces insectorum RCEF 264]
MPPRRNHQNDFVPPLDSGMRDTPYRQNTVWTLQAHTPPPPFGQGYQQPHRRGPAALIQLMRQRLPQSVLCLQTPPVGPEPDPDAPTLTMTIIEELRVHAGQGVQVVACRISGGELVTSTGTVVAPDHTFVAKIYDPLYYFYNGARDVVEKADHDYSREAAAYEHLQRIGVDGELLPAFAGTYTMNVPLEPEQRAILAAYNREPLTEADTTRPVRVLLTDKVEGESMLYRVTFGGLLSLPDGVRLNAIATCMEAYARLVWLGVVHNDFAPRNIFLRDHAPVSNGYAEVDHADLRFHRFVDLGEAYLLGQPGTINPARPEHVSRPCNPIELFWAINASGAINMVDWIPPSVSTTNTFRRWMVNRWMGDPRFEPLSLVPPPLLGPDAVFDRDDAFNEICQWPGSQFLAAPAMGACMPFQPDAPMFGPPTMNQLGRQQMTNFAEMQVAPQPAMPMGHQMAMQTINNRSMQVANGPNVPRPTMPVANRLAVQTNHRPSAQTNHRPNAQTNNHPRTGTTNGPGVPADNQPAKQTTSQPGTRTTTGPGNPAKNRPPMQPANGPGTQKKNWPGKQPFGAANNKYNGNKYNKYSARNNRNKYQKYRGNNNNNNNINNNNKYCNPKNHNKINNNEGVNEASNNTAEGKTYPAGFW